MGKRSGTKTGRKAKTMKNPVGRSLIKDRFGGARGNYRNEKGGYEMHTTELDDNKRDLRSITERNDLSEFLSQAELSARDFTAERGAAIVDVSRGLEVAERKVDVDELREVNAGMTIPRRPQWGEETTGDELDHLEREHFLSWRRDLANLESTHPGVLVTPFEKNIEVWRQLWRTVERSEVVVQIVDGRNPLLFLSTDLKKYVECDLPGERNFLVLVNKADLLPDRVRSEWARYFRGTGTRFAFWSANAEQKRIEEERKDEEMREMREMMMSKDEEDEAVEAIRKLAVRSSGLRNVDSTPHDGDSDDSDDSGYESDSESGNRYTGNNNHLGDDEDFEGPALQGKDREPEDPEARRRWLLERELNRKPLEAEGNENVVEKVLNREELFQLLLSLKPDEKASDDGYGSSDDEGKDGEDGPLALDPGAVLRAKMRRARFGDVVSVSGIQPAVIVGLVGFPNVGKTSTLNVLLSSKVAQVSATPGKTKHFQTHRTDHNVMICDCPGLVFPSVSATKADMICNGILPIDQMRSHREPMELFARWIPRAVIEATYGVVLPTGDDRFIEPRDDITDIEIERGFAAFSLGSDNVDDDDDDDGDDNDDAEGDGSGDDSKKKKKAPEFNNPLWSKAAVRRYLTLRDPTGEQVSQAVAYQRGFMTSAGNPDESRSARLLLKDLVNGKMLHYVLPMDDCNRAFVDPEVWGRHVKNKADRENAKMKKKADEESKKSRIFYQSDDDDEGEEDKNNDNKNDDDDGSDSIYEELANIPHPHLAPAMRRVAHRHPDTAPTYVDRKTVTSYDHDTLGLAGRQGEVRALTGKKKGSRKKKGSTSAREFVRKSGATYAPVPISELRKAKQRQQQATIVTE